jgi:hypothetical protein
MDTSRSRFIREPAGTLNSMTTGGKSYYYLTDATGNVLGLVDDTGKRTHTYAYGPTGLPRGTTTEAAPSPTATPAPTSACTRWAQATTTRKSAASPNPTAPGKRPTPTFTRAATPSTTAIPQGSGSSTVFRTFLRHQ